MGILENIKTPSDLKKLSIKELPILADEIRQLIIRVTDSNGGHLASSLGAVDAIIALYYVFDFPKDKLIFDVGHQAYAHKILSQRYNLFETIRLEGGLSGFPNIFESEYDAFTVGHAGTAISAALGYATARDEQKQNYYVISFVGDGSFFNGESLEALLALDKKPEKLLLILNDNGMSISATTNSFYKVVSKISMKRRYSKFMGFMDKVFGWNFIGRVLKRFKFSIKNSLGSFSFLDYVGIKYVGAFDGNNIKLLVRLLQTFKDSPRTTLLHIKTKKGKGYKPAEDEAEYYHGVSQHYLASINTFSQTVGDYLIELAEKDNKIVAITAGMTYGTGLTEFSKRFPKRFFDVGISEEFAVTYSAGLAIGGLKPIVAIYSTFMQRSYDQIMLDICLQNLPVILLLDRAGLVGSDGATHQGVYDLSYLRNIPNINIFTPKDSEELKMLIDFALELKKPVAIRYPNGIVEKYEKHTKITLNNLWETVKFGDGKVILACGARMLKIALEASKNTNAMVVNARTIKPLDENFLKTICYKEIITLEDNVKIGGFGSAVLEFYANNFTSPKVYVLGVDDCFVSHSSVCKQLYLNGLTSDNLKKYL